MTYVAQDRSRLDVFLARSVADLSRVKAGALIRTGAVTVNARIARKPAKIVLPGDKVEVTASREPASESHITPADLKLKILYEDDACLVIAKPAGIAVHPAPSIKKDEPTILHGIAFLFQKMQIPFSASSILAHRLDRETTGCLLIAKTPQAHRALQAQFKDRTVRKTYLAIVAGVPKEAHAHIDAPIGRNVAERTRMSVMGAAKSRSARTTYRILAASGDAALLACELHTGRTHQIRVHLRVIGHPILGDATYTSPESEALSEKRKIHTLALHAWKLSFRSPESNALRQILAPPPPLFQKSLRTLALSLPEGEE